jgi:hypothetical protein
MEDRGVGSCNKKFLMRDFLKKIDTLVYGNPISARSKLKNFKERQWFIKPLYVRVEENMKSIPIPVVLTGTVTILTF